jgi:hypothetical protein
VKSLEGANPPIALLRPTLKELRQNIPGHSQEVLYNILKILAVFVIATTGNLTRYPLKLLKSYGTITAFGVICFIHFCQLSQGIPSYKNIRIQKHYSKKKFWNCWSSGKRPCSRRSNQAKNKQRLGTQYNQINRKCY